MPCMRGVHIVGGEYYACRKATTAYLNCMRYIQSAGPGTMDEKMRKCATSRTLSRIFHNCYRRGSNSVFCPTITLWTP